MKITVTYESEESDGEVASVSFTKEGLEFLEDYLNAFGRSLHGAGFTYLTSLEATTDTGETFVGHF